MQTRTYDDIIQKVFRIKLRIREISYFRIFFYI